MSECDRCGDDGVRLFRHRTRSETMTYRQTEYVCADCHPSLSRSAVIERGADRAVPDGGTRAIACPTCSGSVIDDGVTVACVDCGWTGRR